MEISTNIKNPVSISHINLPFGNPIVSFRPCCMCSHSQRYRMFHRGIENALRVRIGETPIQQRHPRLELVQILSSANEHVIRIYHGIKI